MKASGNKHQDTQGYYWWDVVSRDMYDELIYISRRDSDYKSGVIDDST
jgi:hypothetical protein